MYNPGNFFTRKILFIGRASKQFTFLNNAKKGLLGNDHRVATLS